MVRYKLEEVNNLSTHYKCKDVEYEIDDNGCWNCTSHSKDRFGYINYKKIYDGNKFCVLHRFVYRIFHGEIRQGNYILHSCDNPNCINPSHLSQGSHLENIQDMVNKGRHSIGEKHPHSKLDESKVRAIKQMLKQKIPQRIIAETFDVKQTTISDINNYRTWWWVSV